MDYIKKTLEVLGKKWALVTAGTEDSFNMMTIEWGGFGSIWGKQVATVYVRKSRYTHEFMDKNDYFTVSFYPEEYKKVLGRLGSKSGRDIDKMKDSGLTPVRAGESMSFKEAECTLVCRKLYVQTLDEDKIPEELKARFYGREADPHDMYIGEVLEVI